MVEPVDLNQIATSVVQMVSNEATLRGMRIELALVIHRRRGEGRPGCLATGGAEPGQQRIGRHDGYYSRASSDLRTTIEPDASVGTIWVEDTGPGFPRTSGTNSFNPSSPPRSTGLGMGLSICQSIVESLNGRIDLKNQNGKGAAFFVELPLA